MCLQLLWECFHFVADLWRHFYEPVGQRSAEKNGRGKRGRCEGENRETQQNRRREREVLWALYVRSSDWPHCFHNITVSWSQKSGRRAGSKLEPAADHRHESGVWEMSLGLRRAIRRSDGRFFKLRRDVCSSHRVLSTLIPATDANLRFATLTCCRDRRLPEKGHLTLLWCVLSVDRKAVRATCHTCRRPLLSDGLLRRTSQVCESINAPVVTVHCTLGASWNFSFFDPTIVLVVLWSDHLGLFPVHNTVLPLAKLLTFGPGSQGVVVEI